jgi:GntR family transcriptional repressor for pyruvate dehydrogenase complex
MQMIKRISVTEEVFNILYDRVISREYKPGDLLPSQDKLAEELGVSRNSIREAINRMASLGIVQLKQGVGTTITPSRGISAHIINIFKSLNLTPHEGLEIAEVRLALERTIVRLAAVKAGPDILSKLEENITKQKRAIHHYDKEQFSDLDVEFHLLIADASGNKTLRQLLEANLSLFHKIISTVMSEAPTVESAVNYHRQIFKAVASHDSKEADNLMVEHIIRISRLLPEHEGYTLLKKAVLD